MNSNVFSYLVFEKWDHENIDNLPFESKSKLFFFSAEITIPQFVFIVIPTLGILTMIWIELKEMNLKYKKQGPYQNLQVDEQVLDIDKILDKEWKITTSLLSMYAF